MTWGALDGTPLRLEQEDTPVDIGGTGAGPAVPRARGASLLTRSFLAAFALPCWFVK